jgi:hypothetical protein
MAYDVKEAPSWPVNELGEIVMQSGVGSGSVVGFIPSNQVPIDPDTKKVTVSGVVGVSNQTTQDIDIRFKQLTEFSVSSITPIIVETTPTIIAGNRYYIDPITGLDTNNGTTPQTPWQNLTKLNGLTCGNGAVIHLASDGVFEYVDTWAAYKAHTTFPFNAHDNIRSTSASAPVLIKPYYPRGQSQSKPIIRWYASISAGEWTQESGLGVNVWSIPYVSADYGTDICVAWGASNALGVLACHRTDAQTPNGQGANPLQMTQVGDFTKDPNKFYFYSNGNPTTTLGSVKIFARWGVFSSYWQGLHNTIFHGLQFELCKAIQVDNESTAPVTGHEVRYCTFKKAQITAHNNANTNASPQECTLSIHDNYLEDVPHSAIRIRTATGTAGNTLSWEVYRNVILRGNLTTSYGGALLYNQAKGGTKHHAWGNYGYDCRNGAGGKEIDGSFIYCDVYSQASVITGNIAEFCGVAFQLNNSLGAILTSNIAIDCIAMSLVTGANDVNMPNQSYTVAHNTWIWTGRVQKSSIQLGPSLPAVGGVNTPVFAEWNDNFNTFGNKFSTYSLCNNLAIDATGDFTGNKRMATFNTAGIITALVSGNASLGFGSANIITNNNVDQTLIASTMSAIGSIVDVDKWMSAAKKGSSKVALDSPLIGIGVPLSVNYVDIKGKSFNTLPTVGSQEI